MFFSLKNKKKKKGLNDMAITIEIEKVHLDGENLVIEVAENQRNALATLLGLGKKKLADLKPKDEFKIGNEVFIVLEQCDGSTKVIAKEFAYEDVKFGDNSNWKNSPIRRTLNDEYFKRIAGIIGADHILPMARDLTSLDGLDDYDSVTDKVSLLTAAEYAKYHKILGLKSQYKDWWWTITPASTPSNDYARSVCVVGSDGVLDWDGCVYSSGVRPFLNLDSSILVLENKD